MERIVRRGGDILGSLEKKLASWPTVTAEQRARAEAAFARSEAFVAAARKAGYNSVWKSNPACCAACRELNRQTLRGNFRPPLHAGCSCAVALGERLTSDSTDDIIPLLPRSFHQEWNETLPTTLEVDYPFLKGVIPGETEIHDIVVIAGEGTSRPIRDINRLKAQHPEETGEWQKKAGVVSGEYAEYYVHWYAASGAGPEEEYKLKEAKPK